jgi:hypothetical protein
MKPRPDMKVHVVIATNLNITKRHKNTQVKPSPVKVLCVKEVHCPKTGWSVLKPMHISKSGIPKFPHFLSSKTKNDAHTYLSVRDRVFTKHEKIAFLKQPLELTTSIPQQISDFCFNNHFLITHLLLIPALQFVTHVEAKAILDRPVTNIGTKCITYIHSSRKMQYFWPICVLHDDITRWDTVTPMCETHTIIAFQIQKMKGFTNKTNNTKRISYIFF